MIEEKTKELESAPIFIAKCLGISLVIASIVTMNPLGALFGLIGMVFGLSTIVTGNAPYLVKPALYDPFLFWIMVLSPIAIIALFSIGLYFRKRWFSYILMIKGFLIWMFVGVMGLGPA